MKPLNKQLWGRALDRAVPETYTTLSSEQLGKAIDEYTELVVKECLNQCETIRSDAQSQKESSFLTPTGVALYEGVYGGATNCGFAIQQHFGIE